MSNSPLVTYTKLSPNHSGRRNHVIDTVSIHCMAGNASVETCGALFADPSRKSLRWHHPPCNELRWCQSHGCAARND